MPVFYHIDRLNQLKVGDTINLIRYKDINCNNPSLSEDLQKQVDSFLPEGVSSHGNQYYVSSTIFNDTSADIELIFEYERKCNFPHLPSRFQSFFAVDREYLLVMFQRLKASMQNCSIYEVECDEYFKGDMNLLVRNSNLVSTYLANTYWKGESLGNPLNEYLLKPPVKILRKINLEELL